MLGFKEFLTEASLGGMHRTGKTVLDYYVLDSDLNRVEYQIEKDTKMLDSIESNTDMGTLTKQDVVTIVSKDVTMKGKVSYIRVSSKRLGTGYIQVSAIRKPTGERSFNRGDVSEGIIAASIATKFTIPNRTIEVADVYSTIEKLKGNKEIDLTNPEGDTIKFVVKLKPASYDALVSHQYRNDLSDEYAGAVKFANSKTVERYAVMLNQNGTKDTVVSVSDGTSDEKGTKVDMNVLVGLNGQTPRKVKNLSLSLKSGNTKTIAQIGTKLERVIEFWKWFGITIKPDNYEKTESWFANLFHEVVTDINYKLGSDTKEKTFLTALAKGIEHAATGGDTSVTMLHIKKGDFKVHSFKNIDTKLKDINLKAVSYTESLRPEIHIVDTISNEKLVGFRLEVRDAGKTLKIHVEKGPLLNTLTQMK